MRPNKNELKNWIVLIAIASAISLAATLPLSGNSFAQKNPIPSPDEHAFINACVKPEPNPPNAAFCLPA